MDISFLIIPSFIAGILTFLAPCTLPLIPAYLSFISGTSVSEAKKDAKTRARVFLNGVFYVVGFSAVFILLGSLFGLGGSAFLQYRFILTRLGGIFIILFGFFLLAPALAVLTKERINLLKLPVFRILMQDRPFSFVQRLQPGKPMSSLMFGGTFALGWSPCVGPILGSVLTLAASSATVGQGAFLLSVFSLGLAMPFLATALAIGWASSHLAKIGRYLNWVAAVGGVFLILLGVIMVTDNFALWIALFYKYFNFINYEGLLDYL